MLYYTDPIEGIQLRADEGGGPGVVAGDLMVYGDVATRPGGILERFDVGSLQPFARGVLARYMHQRHMPLARMGYSMDLEDGPERMSVEIRLADDAMGQRTAREIDDGRLQGLSAEFVPVRHRAEGRTVIHQSTVLVGVGVVDIPSYPASTVVLRHELLAAAAPAPARRRRVWL